MPCAFPNKVWISASRTPGINIKNVWSMSCCIKMQDISGVYLHMDTNRALLWLCCTFSTRDESFSLLPTNVRPRQPSTGTPRWASFDCSATTTRGGPCHTRTCPAAASCPTCWAPGTCWCPHWRGGVGRPTSTACGASAARSPPAPGWTGPLWRSVSAARSPGWRCPFLEREIGEGQGEEGESSRGEGGMKKGERFRRGSEDMMWLCTIERTRWMDV